MIVFVSAENVRFMACPQFSFQFTIDGAFDFWRGENKNGAVA